MRVIIAGGRTFNDYPLLCEKCDNILAKVRTPITIVSGGCVGADKLGEEYANERGYPVVVYPYIKGLGKAGGPVRNQQMADNADALIAFWDEFSTGTGDMIKKARKKGLLIRVIFY